MANTQKLTKAQKYAMLKELAEVKANPTLVEFIDHELELLAKKNGAERKPTAKQVANDGLKTAILNAMESGRGYTISELLKVVPELTADENMTSQRVSALVTQLKDAGMVVRTEDKRKAYFTKAEN